MAREPIRSAARPPDGQQSRPSESRGRHHPPARRWQTGDSTAEGELWPILYAELEVLASSSLRRGGRVQTLQTTELLNEALRLTSTVQRGTAGQKFARSAKLSVALPSSVARSKTAASEKTVELGQEFRGTLAQGPDPALESGQRRDACLRCGSTWRMQGLTHSVTDRVRCLNQVDDDAAVEEDPRQTAYSQLSRSSRR